MASHPRRPAAQHAARRRTRAGARSRLIVLTLGLLAALLLGTFVHTGARADLAGEGVIIQGMGRADLGNTMWLHPLEAPQGAEQRYTWCTNGGKPEPPLTAAIRKESLSESRQWGPPELDVTPAEMAWILATKEKEGSAASNAAIAYLVHLNFEGPAPDHGVPDPAAAAELLVRLTREQAPEVDSRARDYVRQARATAVRSYEAGSVTGADTRDGEVRGLGVRNATGWVAGRPLTVRLEGPAVFVETGSSEWRGMTASEPLSLAWTATGNGMVRALITYERTERSTVTILRSVSGEHQDVLTGGDRPEADPVERVRDIPWWRVIHDFQPMATSDVGGARLVDPASGTISDTLTVSADPAAGQPWIEGTGGPVPVRFTGTAYFTGERPARTAATPPAGAEVVAQREIVATGPSVHTVEAPVSRPGFVTWVWRMVREAQDASIDLGTHTYRASELIRSDWADSFGLPAETTSVRHRVEVDSMASTRRTKAGTYLVDDLFVTGFPSDHPDFPGDAGFGADRREMTHSLYFFPDGLDVIDDNLDEARLVSQVSVPARNGPQPDVSSTDFLVPPDSEPGTWVFVTEFAGDDRVLPFRSSVSDAHEAHVVTPEPVEVWTSARDASAQSGKGASPSGGEETRSVGSDLQSGGVDADTPMSAPIDHRVASDAGSRIIDTVCASGLTPGIEYTVDGFLVDRDTSRPVTVDGEPVHSARTWTAGSARPPSEAERAANPLEVDPSRAGLLTECVDVEFILDTRGLEGRGLVVFEKLHRNGRLVAEHTDPTEVAQWIDVEEPPTPPVPPSAPPTPPGIAHTGASDATRPIGALTAGLLLLGVLIVLIVRDRL